MPVLQKCRPPASCSLGGKLLLGHLVVLGLLLAGCEERERSDEGATPVLLSSGRMSSGRMSSGRTSSGGMSSGGASVASSGRALMAPEGPEPPTSTSGDPRLGLVETDAPLVIIAGGDVNLGRETGQRLLRDPSYDPFESLRPLFSKADLVFVNLESQLSEQAGETQSRVNRLIFTGPPQGAPALARAGVDIVSLANNHAWDYGRKAFEETFAHLAAASVHAVGASLTPHQQHRPVVIEKRGYRVAWFAVTAIWNQGPLEEHPARYNVAWADYYALHQELQQLKPKADVTLVSYHGGGEYLDLPLGKTREFVRVSMDAGVDAVLGHHPHVIQGVGWFGGRPAFYSLGNLVFNQHKDHFWTRLGVLARLSFDRSGLIKTEACPYDIVDLKPQPLAAGQPLHARLMRHLKHVSLSVKGTTLGEPGPDGCFELSPPG